MKIEEIKIKAEKLVGRRFKNKEQLNSWLKENLNIYHEVQDVEEDDLSDWAFIVGIYKDYGYIDIYYLKDKHDQYYITEVCVSDE